MQTVDVEQQPPEPRAWEAPGEEAVELCREWMIFLGATETVVASGDARRVCDLYCDRYVAWVHEVGANLNIDVVQRAASLGAFDGRRALIFVPGGVRPIARQCADELGVALFRFDAHNGILDGANVVGRQLREAGLG